MAPSQSSGTAARLKEEGNALFVKKEFETAHEKYTEAIALDGQNAVLYANRSACNLGMGRNVDALRDAHKATKIDPTYAKGWSRCAAAFEAAEEWRNAMVSWQEALDALRKGKLSPAEIKQKEQYTASLEKAKQRLEASLTTRTGITVPFTEQMPWQAAAEMLPELIAIGRASLTSSAYLIHYANKDFVEGVEYMKLLKEVDVKHPSGKPALMGHTGAITCISNALLSDSRVFRIESPDWMDRYNRQLIFECEKFRAWILENVDGVQRSALERLKKEGWDGVRPALSTVVRGWYMRAMFDVARAVHHIAVERLKDVLDLLHWGRQVWKDVPKDDRGTIFEDTFVRGIKVAYLNSLMQAHTQATDNDKQAFLDTLFEMATELQEEMYKYADGPVHYEPIEAGFLSAFIIHPLAEAHAMLGYYHNQMGQSSTSERDEEMHFLTSFEHYTRAAHSLPEDEEKFCWYLHCSIRPGLLAGVSKEDIMDAVQQIRSATPKMQRIWANSALAKQGRDTVIEETLLLVEQKLK